MVVPTTAFLFPPRSTTWESKKARKSKKEDIYVNPDREDQRSIFSIIIQESRRAEGVGVA